MKHKHRFRILGSAKVPGYEEAFVYFRCQYCNIPMIRLERGWMWHGRIGPVFKKFLEKAY